MRRDFPDHRVAPALSCQQMPWVPGETAAEEGAMNVFGVFDYPDGGK